MLPGLLSFVGFAMILFLSFSLFVTTLMVFFSRVYRFLRRTLKVVAVTSNAPMEYVFLSHSCRCWRLHLLRALFCKFFIPSFYHDCAEISICPWIVYSLPITRWLCILDCFWAITIFIFSSVSLLFSWSSFSRNYLRIVPI